MNTVQTNKVAPPGMRWICCRYRWTKDRKRLLDAHDYGYEAWCFLVPSR
jgi:hypothetical protein